MPRTPSGHRPLLQRKNCPPQRTSISPGKIPGRKGRLPTGSSSVWRAEVQRSPRLSRGTIAPCPLPLPACRNSRSGALGSGCPLPPVSWQRTQESIPSQPALSWVARLRMCPASSPVGLTPLEGRLLQEPLARIPTSHPSKFHCLSPQTQSLGKSELGNEGLQGSRVPPLHQFCLPATHLLPLPACSFKATILTNDNWLLHSPPCATS